MNQLIVFADRAPALIAADGERASYRFFEFFTTNIRNPHTRRAYARAASQCAAPVIRILAHRPLQTLPARSQDRR